MQACEELDFVARNEFDFTIKEVAEGRDFASITGLSYRDADGRIVHNDERAILHNMDELPFVSPVYKRDLEIENYFIGYLRHPYLSFYTGRGCKSRCTFCLCSIRAANFSKGLSRCHLSCSCQRVKNWRAQPSRR